MSLVDWPLIERFRTISQVSIPHAAQSVLCALGITVAVHGNIPSNGPILFIANHGGGLDTVSLLNVIQRTDIYFVALASYRIYGKIIGTRLLPIYRKKMFRDYTLDILASGLQHHVQLSIDDLRNQNRLSINRAAQLVSKGAAVLIFPTGTAGKTPTTGTWKAGVGHLAQQVTNPKARVVFIHISHGSFTDLLRYLTPALRRLFFKPKTVGVTFSKPFLLRELIDRQHDGKTIALQLEEKYSAVFI